MMIIYTLIAMNLLGGQPLLKAIEKGLSESHSFYEGESEFAREVSHYGRLWNFGSFASLAKADIRSSGYVVDTLEASLWCRTANSCPNEALCSSQSETSFPRRHIKTASHAIASTAGCFFLQQFFNSYRHSPRTGNWLTISHLRSLREYPYLNTPHPAGGTASASWLCWYLPPDSHGEPGSCRQRNSPPRHRSRLSAG